MNYADIQAGLQRMTPLVKTTVAGEERGHILQRSRKSPRISDLSRDSPGDNTFRGGLPDAGGARIE
ncbi:hypothetical protein [Pseudomonas sp. Hp2]|uniref:hypothetical protein n=1 Tax=Pseudomonas sp. Hp2 TaxID=701189 RepID=UPI00112C52C2|nr:hypothetical protein [Pseudomonas sp. Hp2]